MSAVPGNTPEVSDAEPRTEQRIVAVVAGPGQTWRQNDTGAHVVLLGRRTTSWIARQTTGGQKKHIQISLTTLDTDFEYVACDHERWCCTGHRTHTSPHRGCVLR